MKYFLLFLLLCTPAYAQEEERFEYSRFFHAKELVKKALETETLRAARFKKTKDLQTAVVSSLTGSLLGLRSKYGIDFAVISNDLNNTKEGLSEGIMIITVKVKYKDEKGEIVWELTSATSPHQIDFYSVIDNGEEYITINDTYIYKRLYRQ